jgi:hypothetical protein
VSTKKRGTNWEDEPDGNYILFGGQAWGDMKGKVKTQQIGFIRNEKKPSRPKVVTKRNK